VALIPKNGGLLFFDMMAIPADAPHPRNAHLFMNYVMRAEVHASLTNKVFYANPNRESRKFVKPEVANNPSVFPSSAEMKTMVPPKALNNDIRRQITRVYTAFKTGF
jgi:putrescine transport system substrate-binding protein